MARLLNRESLLRSFLLEWNDRWISAGRPPGEIVFQTPYGPVRLDASGQFLKVEAVEQSGFRPLAVGSARPYARAAYSGAGSRRR